MKLTHRLYLVQGFRTCGNVPSVSRVHTLLRPLLSSERDSSPLLALT